MRKHEDPTETPLVVGGDQAVGGDVIDALTGLGIEVTRAILIDGTSPTAWADGFAAALEAATVGAPVLLTADSEVPEVTAAELTPAEGLAGGLVCGATTTATACQRAGEIRAIAGEP